MISAIISRKKNSKGRPTNLNHDHTLNPETMPQEPEKATLEGKNKFLGLWFFLGGETVLFASLFGTFVALRNSTAGGPTSQEMFGLGLVFIMTVLLLTSSLTSVYAIYTRVGFHGGHVIFGVSWLITLLIRNAKRGLNLYNAPKFYIFSLYWHFIDVVWVFVFTVVYLMGKVG